MLAVFRVLFSPPIILLGLSANVLEMRCQNTQTLSWISLKVRGAHLDFIHASSPQHLPTPCIYVCMRTCFFTGHSQKTETTKAPSPEHSGCGGEVAKGPSAYNQSFSLLMRQDKTPFSFLYNLKTKIYISGISSTKINSYFLSALAFNCV